MPKWNSTSKHVDVKREGNFGLVQTRKCRSEPYVSPISEQV